MFHRARCLWYSIPNWRIRHNFIIHLIPNVNTDSHNTISLRYTLVLGSGVFVNSSPDASLVISKPDVISQTIEDVASLSCVGKLTMKDRSFKIGV